MEEAKHGEYRGLSYVLIAVPPVCTEIRSRSVEEAKGEVSACLWLQSRCLCPEGSESDTDDAPPPDSCLPRGVMMPAYRVTPPQRSTKSNNIKSSNILYLITLASHGARGIRMFSVTAYKPGV